SGHASFVDAMLPAAGSAHAIVASYNGNAPLDTSSGSVNHTITKARLAVTADDFSRLYGQTNPDFTARYSGFVLGEDPSALGGTLGISTPATASSGVGSYAVTPGGLTSTNYTITFTNGSLSITPATLIVVASNASRSYGTANPVLGGGIV